MAGEGDIDEVASEIAERATDIYNDSLIDWSREPWTWDIITEVVECGPENGFPALLATAQHFAYERALRAFMESLADAAAEREKGGRE